ncbi:hypothetical protein HH308_15030 [Gordonia sp. TBRC 11910]|uniref:Secreted protein n=1 Tax=Gordonia asplenii TaxID=2725283 RepID=A0A848L4I9_9ACTN|nr:hypothetical protein [Gordonia asplenii]NMO02528.1 hypothetical protein [Gordonia asplenii]
MKKRIITGLLAVAAAGAVATAVPTTASAAPVEPHQVSAFGSVSLCFGVPLGPVSVTVCL